MKTPLTPLVLSLALLAGPVLASPVEGTLVRDTTVDARLKARYCDKLREGALPYVLFVRRLKPIYGYTYADFVPEYPGAPVIADCGASPERIAAVRELLRVAKADDKR